MSNHKSYKAQLKKAETLLADIASTAGKLRQSLWEWDKALKNCPDMMKETEDDIKLALQPSGKAIIQICNNLTDIDKQLITSMMQNLARLAKKSTTPDNIWKTNYEKGRSDAQNNIVIKKASFDSFNDFNNQLAMISNIIETIEGVSTYVTLTQSKYSQYEFDIQQQKFMKQYCDTLKQKCFTPRKQDFQNIKTKLDVAKSDITNIKLHISLNT